MSTLAVEDKIILIDQKIRNFDYSLYSVQLDILAEEAVSSPDADLLIALNAKRSDLELKISVLTAEKSSLQ